MNKSSQSSPMSESTLHTRRWLVAIVLIAAAVRVYLALSASVIARDGTQYVTMARRMVFDWRAELAQDYPLGYPFLIRVANAFGGFALSSDPVLAWQRSGQAVSILAGLISVLCIFSIGRRMVDARLGLLAAAIWTLLPQAASLSADALSDMPCLAASLLGVLALMRGIEQKRFIWFLVCGLLSGAGYATRPEGAEVVLTAMALTSVQRALPVTLRIRAVLLAALGFGILGGGYAYLDGGRFFNKQTWLTDAPAVVHSGGVDTGELHVGSSNSHAAMTQIDLGRAVGSIVEKLNNSLNTVWMIVAIAFPLLSRFSLGSRWGLRSPFWAWIALHTVVLMWFRLRAGYVSNRHVLPMTFAMVLLAAGTLHWIESRARSKSSTGAGGFSKCIGPGVIGLVTFFLWPWLFDDIGDGRGYIRDAATWIRREYPDRAPNIVSGDGWVPFYAGAISWDRYGGLEDLPKRSELLTAKVLVVDVKLGPPPQVVSPAGGGLVRLDEAARFISKSHNRGVVLYHVQKLSG